MVVVKCVEVISGTDLKTMGSVLLHTLNCILHTKRRRAKNDLTLHTVCKIFKEKKLKIGKI